MTDNVASAFQMLHDRGYSDVQASGILGNLMQEKAGLDPSLTSGVGDGGISHGIAQWNGPRYQGLLDYATGQKQDPNTLGAQIGYLDQELRSTEGRAMKNLQGAQDPAAAAAAFEGFERPQGFSYDNPAAGNGYANRVSNAQGVFATHAGATPIGPGGTLPTFAQGKAPDQGMGGTGLALNAAPRPDTTLGDALFAASQDPTGGIGGTGQQLQAAPAPSKALFATGGPKNPNLLAGVRGPVALGAQNG